MKLVFLSKIIALHSCAESAVSAVYEATEDKPDVRRLMYVVLPGMLRQKHTEKEIMLSLHQFATFDVDSEHKLVANGAKVFLRRFLKWTNQPKFIKDLEENTLSGFVSGDLLYVAHLCVKPHSKKYQVTTFGRGIGPLGDSQHETGEKILASGAEGAGIPFGARFVKSSELPLVEQAFMPR